jgi:hypothetical protein
MPTNYRDNKQREMSRVPEGSRWVFTHPPKKPRLIAQATMRYGKLVIEQAIDMTDGTQITDAIGSVHDLPSPACRAVEPSIQFNGWIQWRWCGNVEVTLDDVERGRVILPPDQGSPAVRLPVDPAA